uniref:Uncharacterized protein n=1 Tax=Rhizophora mucronata TaxID=61149 RepID=A0A2P2PT72_RHIMU
MLHFYFYNYAHMPCTLAFLKSIKNTSHWGLSGVLSISIIFSLLGCLPLSLLIVLIFKLSLPSAITAYLVIARSIFMWCIFLSRDFYDVV